MPDEEIQAEPTTASEPVEKLNTPAGGSCNYSYECGARLWCCNDGLGGVCRPNTEPCW
ncbi:hypothetical protein ACLESO_26095 [Pyxidicoccus sp. 3LG]